MVKKPYVVSYSKRHLELRNMNNFQYVFELVEFFLIDVSIVNFLLPFIFYFFLTKFNLLLFIVKKIYFILNLI